MIHGAGAFELFHLVWRMYVMSFVISQCLFSLSCPLLDPQKTINLSLNFVETWITEGKVHYRHGNKNFCLSAMRFELESALFIFRGSALANWQAFSVAPFDFVR